MSGGGGFIEQYPTRGRIGTIIRTVTAGLRRVAAK